MQRVAATCCLVLALLAAGCAAPKDRKVSGTVTWEGKPVEAGTITFMPADSSVAPATAKIVGGKYEVTTPPGSKTVQIFANRAVGPVLDHMGMAAQEMYIPEEYNARSILEVEVTATGDNIFPFDLPQKPK